MSDLMPMLDPQKANECQGAEIDENKKKCFNK